MTKPSAITLRQERFSDLRRTIDGRGETVSTRFQTIETLYEQQQEPYLPT